MSSHIEPFKYTRATYLSRPLSLSSYAELTANRPPQSTSAGVQKKKKRRPSVALSNLKSLAESLQEAAKKAAARGQREEGAAVGTLRARERIVKEESQRLQAVLQHPQFQADPLAAIASHLEATLPPPPPPPKVKQDPRQRRLQKKLKKQQLKAEQQGNDMDM